MVQGECSSGIGNTKGRPFLKRGLTDFETEFGGAQLSMEELHYSAKEGGGEKGRHTVESRALVLMLCILVTRRQTRVHSKQMSLKLLRFFWGVHGLWQCQIGIVCSKNGWH